MNLLLKQGDPVTASVQAKANSTPLASEFSARAC